MTTDELDLVLPCVAAKLGLIAAVLDEGAGAKELLSATVDLLARALGLAGFGYEEAWALANGAAARAFPDDESEYLAS